MLSRWEPVGLHGLQRLTMLTGLTELTGLTGLPKLPGFSVTAKKKKLMNTDVFSSFEDGTK